MDDSYSEIHFSEALNALLDLNTPFPARYLRSFTDLSRKNLRELMSVWRDIPEVRKVSFLEDLEEILDADTLVCFDVLARNVLNDPSASVRALALRLLWECEEANLIPDLTNLSVTDEDETVRATAASLLGKFVLLGELDALKPDQKDLVENHLISIVQGNDLARVRQHALESLGYTSNPLVTDLIQNAYLSEDPAWISCAIVAMGRSADEAWAPQVEKMLTSSNPDIQFEAIRAAGELELTGSREKLFSLLENGLDDEETRLALIWSLSQIGGDEVKEKLEDLLAVASDEDEIEWIEKAIENIGLSTSADLDLLDFSTDKDDNFDEDEEDDLDVDNLYEDDMEDEEDN